ncbi:MAG: hypothetical protein RLZZ385_1533 [Pseudomonadota bacterium]|jgi:glycosyltransferase involved in cell wall biosynthesis
MSTPAPQPLVTIGMPIRNEAAFLTEALECLLAQDYPNVEIIISDNASSDTTADICQQFCSRHSTIRYQRQAENIGAAANFDAVLRQANGEFFLWASGHDRWQSNYLSACVARLQAHPSAVIAFGSTHWIDGEGQPHAKQTGWSDTRGLHPVARYCTVFWGNMNPIIAVIRTANLQACRLQSMVGLDLVILLKLALQGDFVHATDTAWYRRQFREEAAYRQKLQRYSSADYGLNRSLLGRLFPLAKLPMTLLGDVFAAAIPWSQKLMLLLILLPSLPVKYLADRSRR